MEKLQSRESREVLKDEALNKLLKASNEALKALQAIADPSIPQSMKSELVSSYFVKLLTSDFIDLVLSPDEAELAREVIAEGNIKANLIFSTTVSIEVAWFVRIGVSDESPDPAVRTKWFNKREALCLKFIEKLKAISVGTGKNLEFLKMSKGASIPAIQDLRKRIVEDYLNGLKRNGLFETFCIEEELIFVSDEGVKNMLFSNPEYAKQYCENIFLEYEMRNYFLESGELGDDAETKKKFEVEIQEIMAKLNRQRFFN